MAKKASKKKGVKKKARAKKPKTPKKTVSPQSVEIKMQPVLVDNFIALQRVMVNLSAKFETLNKQLASLLNLFEMSAKALSKKDFKFGQSESNEKVVGKLTELTEQNKVLAKGLTMIHEDEQEQKQMIAPPVVPAQLAPPKQVPVPRAMPPKPKPLPKPTSPTSAAPKQPQGEEQYQKSAPTDKPKAPAAK